MISHLWFLFRTGIVLSPHTYARWNSTNQQDLKPPILKFEAPKGKLQLWCQGTQLYIIWLFLSQADSRGGGREEGKGKGEEDGILIAPTLISHSWSTVLQSGTISSPLCTQATLLSQALQEDSQSFSPITDGILVQKSVLWTPPLTG